MQIDDGLKIMHIQNFKMDNLYLFSNIFFPY
jgi:hypothetical protein